MPKHLHFNIPYSNKILYWSGTDTHRLWLKNTKDIFNWKYFEENGWHTGTSISYVYNSHGFRTTEFTDQEAFVALGCSFTEGVGLQNEKVWPSLLEEKLNSKVWNLGVGGASFDTCFRLLDHYIDKLNIKGVFILEPPRHRFEIHRTFETVNVSPQSKEYQSFFKEWILDDDNTDYNIKKNRYSVGFLCRSKKIPIISLPIEDLSERFPYSRARDLLHVGPLAHEYIANQMYEQYLQQLNT